MSSKKSLQKKIKIPTISYFVIVDKKRKTYLSFFLNQKYLFKFVFFFVQIRKLNKEKTQMI